MRLSDIPAGTRIASGEFGARGLTGRIEITANGSEHGFDVALVGLSPVPAAGTSIEFNAEPVTASDEALHEGFSHYSYQALEQVPDQTFTTPRRGHGGFQSSDPSYLRSAVLWAAPEGAPVGLGSVVASAPLTWELPQAFPGLQVVDHGSSEGARGLAGSNESGSPLTYRVASGDAADAIAARFGITIDELRWLNPDREPGRFILADSTLNLARDARGIRQ